MRGDNLPAAGIAEELSSLLTQHNNVVVTAPPGAGKSTLLPLTVLRNLHRISGSEVGKVVVLEPRRLAAIQIARRMAWMLGEPVGKTVGYRVRHESRVSAETRIEVLTEGILARMLIDDPTIEDKSVIIFDEFHERSINTDTAFALARESQQLIRPDLRIVVMSATIDTAAICTALDAPLLRSEGRMFPVTITYTDNLPWTDLREMPEVIVRTIIQAHRQDEGDILVFLPGEADIRRCQELMGTSLTATDVCPLYGMLSAEQQQRAIAPSPDGRRKIVLATSIAETSLTIEGVRIVIDSGLCRRMVFDQRTGLSHLQTTQISLDMANQRSGRAGRVASGRCYRLWSKATELRMDECRKPEIEEADLASMLLDVAAWGETDAARLPWLTPPPPANVTQGTSLLQILGAIDDKCRITCHGRKLWQHPYHPRIAQMLVMAKGADEQRLALHIAEVLEAPPSSWRSHFYQPGAGRLIACAWPERIAMQQDNGVGYYRLASGDRATVDASDPLSSNRWISIASMNANAGGRVFLAAPVSPDELTDHIQERDNISWDKAQGCIVAQRERRIGSLVVSSRPIHDGNHDLIVQTICEAARKLGTSMFDFNDDVLALQRRIAAVALWHPELLLPDVSTDKVLKECESWLPIYIGKSTTTTELKKIDLCYALWGLLTYDQQQSVDRLAPTHLYLPYGKRVRVEYRQGAELPIVRVRIQDCFGLNETPRIDGGQRSVLMELLSPGFKPVQLTQDLHHFWESTYFEVRKELRRRYPKHSWPDNPC